MWQVGCGWALIYKNCLNNRERQFNSCKEAKVEEEMLLEFSEAWSMLIVNMCFVKVYSMKVTYESGGSQTG